MFFYFLHAVRFISINYFHIYIYKWNSNNRNYVSCANVEDNFLACMLNIIFIIFSIFIFKIILNEKKLLRRQNVLVKTRVDNRFSFTPTIFLSSCGFWFQLEMSYMSIHTEELWFNEIVCLWLTIYTLPHPRSWALCKALRMNWALWDPVRQNVNKQKTRLIAFHIALIPLGKVWIQLFSLQLWINSRTD